MRKHLHISGNIIHISTEYKEDKATRIHGENTTLKGQGFHRRTPPLPPGPRPWPPS